MLNMNILIGRLGLDPEVIEEEGRSVTRLRIATHYRGGRATWHDVEVRGTRGKACARCLKKGSLVGVIGRELHRKVRGADGTSVVRPVILAVWDVLFLDRAQSLNGEDADQDLPMPTDSELNIPPEEAELEADDRELPEIEF